MVFLTVLATVFGILMSIANFPQAYKIFTTKSAKDISPVTYAIFASGSVVWLMYGIEIMNYPIIWSYGPGTVSATLVLVGWFMYGRKK